MTDVEINRLNLLVANALSLDVEVDDDTEEVWFYTRKMGTSTMHPAVVSPTATPCWVTRAILYDPAHDWYQAGELISKYIKRLKFADGLWYAEALSGVIQYHEDPKIAICKSLSRGTVI